ncbi:probable disease resistance protein At4g27220 [Syzygium oleosum]|uniref:probable disease resistance protein At4g27220 n=1 Tax=Syzygium oleosum TaxID=219896 RepID=UPI0024BADB80|nr:probable disease resistance protein At4g27220 [Syzygium oleosum]
MPRVEDIAWKFVIRLERKKWRCPYCEAEYSGQVTRVKSHFLKIPNRGISFCTKVPEHIIKLMQQLLDQVAFVGNKDDMAWKFVDRLGDNKWRCHYCSEEFIGDLTGVKCHLLKVPNEGISICAVVPDPVRTLMRSLLDEVADEEESREANGQTSTEPQSRDMTTQAEVVADEEESREANVQFSTEPQTRDMPTQAEVVAEEEESREANVQVSTEPLEPFSFEELLRNLDKYMEQLNTPTDIGLNSDQQSQVACQSRDMQPPALRYAPTSSELVEQSLPAPEGVTDMENFTSNQERQLHQSITMLSLVQNSHGESISCSEEGEPYLRDSPYPEETQTNDQHTLPGASLFHDDQLPAVGNSNCLQDCNQHSQLQTPMDIDPSIASQHTSDSHIIEATIVDSQVREAATNAIGPSSTQASVHPQHQSFAHQSINLRTAHVDPCIPSSSQAPNNALPTPQIPPCGTGLVGQSSLPGETISCSTMALAELQSCLLISPNQPQCSIRSPYPEETLMNDQQTPAGASSFQHDELPAVGNSNCLQDCNQHSQLQTPMDIDPSIGSQHTSDSHIIEATIVDVQVPEVATNAAGPSSSHDMNRGSPIMNVRSIYANDEEIRNLKRKVEELDYKEADINDQMEIESAASSVPKKPRRLVGKWLKETERARNAFQIIGQTNAETLPPKEQVETLTREVEELTEQTLPQPLLIEMRDAKGDAFLERKLIGEEIHRNIELIWDRLKENHVCKLGIYGMGGVGKTTIMMHIHNRLLKDATFDGVLFITVSQDFSVYKLQSDIWKALKFGIMEDEHEKKRAAMLSKHLERKNNCVLILDDVWRHFKLQDVGIPDRAGLKVVLTTRFSEVCSRMDCEEIKIQPLGEEEAWKLFVEELGPKPLTDIRVEKVARKITNRCAGLPLAIDTMASSLRGEKNFCVWQDTLNKLDKSHTKHTEMGDRVLPVLTLSYERLSDPQVKQCFLFCALFPEDERIEQVELIEYFIDEGFLDELDTRDAQYYRGLAIVDMLRKACLLEVNNYDVIRMHDLIREMALHIRGTAYMVNAGWDLRRIPNGEYWTEDLEKVSLMGGDIEDIPPDMSPNCPKLSTLLLNWSLRSENVRLNDSFFMKLQGLKVLNLSGCEIRALPDSLSELVNLRALLLRDCRFLLCIPHLRKLKFLRKLDARGCWSLVEVQGLEELTNLRYLDLCETGIERLLEGTLRRMVNLQYLTIAGTVEAEEVIQLKALERLKCYFGNVDDFNKYVRFVERSNPHRDSLSLSVYEEESLLSVNTRVYSNPRKSLWILQESQYKSYRNHMEMSSYNCAMARVGKESNNDSILIPGDVEYFMGSNCHGMTNLSGVGLLRCLKELQIFEWDDLVVLVGGDGVDEVVCNTRDSPASLFPSLEKLQIEGCSKLKYLFGHESGFSLSLGGPAFPRLEITSVTNCGSMKTLVGSEWFPHFPNLRSIRVENCNSIRELLWHESLLHLPNLAHIMVVGCEGIEEITSRRGENHEGSPPLNTPSSSLPSPFSPYFRNLRTIEVENCNNIMELLPHYRMNVFSIFQILNISRLVTVKG